MISRREFLKILGLSTAAYSTGLFLGKNFWNNNSDIYLTAFLPEENFYTNFLIQKFVEKIEDKVDKHQLQSLKKIRFQSHFTNSNLSNGVINPNDEAQFVYGNDKVFIAITKANYPFNCDIFLKDNEENIYSPDKLSEIFFIRDEIRNKPAKVKLICSFNNQHDFLGLNRRNKKIVIESENEIYDEIPLNSNYKNIVLKNNIGIVKLSVGDCKVKIHSSTCRNKLCVHSGSINQLNENLICAPNKIFIKITNA
ncbi:MAG: NusG domain II-containing protein [Ignavibacteria bacterium]|nr:NusG domain II-containing protein [Ignavibacteria bacterium]